MANSNVKVGKHYRLFGSNAKVPGQKLIGKVNAVRMSSYSDEGKEDELLAIGDWMIIREGENLAIYEGLSLPVRNLVTATTEESEIYKRLKTQYDIEEMLGL